MPRTGGDESAVSCAAAHEGFDTAFDTSVGAPECSAGKRQHSAIALCAVHEYCSGVGYRNQTCLRSLKFVVKNRKGTIIRTALALIAAGIVGVTALASPSPG